MLLVYGATGYTGRLIAEAARARGEGTIVAGRNAARLRGLGDSLGCEHRICGLDDPARLDALLSGVDVVLNAASPFASTALPLADACLRAGAHYLDVAGDVAVFEQLHALDGEARRRGVMLMPGVGFTVAASDCLAAHLAERLPGARSLVIGISRPTLWSRGSMKTLMDLWSDEVDVRRDGVLQSIRIGELERDFDYGWGPRPSAAMRWPDVFTAYLTTGIPNVEVYGEVDSADRVLIHWTRWFGRFADTTPWRRFTKLQWEILPEGPSDAARAEHRRVIVAEVRNDAGRCAGARLRTPEPYTFTVETVCAVVDRIRRGDVQQGFQTPGGAYGPELVLDLETVCLEEFQATQL